MRHSGHLIDCGTEHTGYGLIESDGRSHRMIAAGSIHTSPKEPLEVRLLVIAQGLREVIQAHTPESAAVEEVFYAQNVKTALKLSHARGVVLLTIAEAGLSVGEYSPLEIKTSVVGYGRAEKQQVKTDGAFPAGASRRRSNPKMLATRSRWPSATPPHASTALRMRAAR